MTKKADSQTQSQQRFNALHKAVVLAFPILYLGSSLSAFSATTLTEGQDVRADGLALGEYDLILDGNVSWNNEYIVNSAANAVININGNGNVITAGAARDQRLIRINNTVESTISITNAIIETQPFTGPHSSLIKIENDNVTANINLEGTIFRNIGPTNLAGSSNADYAPILNIRGANGSVMNIDGGTQGVLFQNNRGEWDQSGSVSLTSNNTMNFTGLVTFDGNSTGNYGGAVAIQNDGTNQIMNFNGETYFRNNHSYVYAGAIDLWGGNGTVLTFNGLAEFTGNYVFGAPQNTTLYPEHVVSESSRGGAINIGTQNPGNGGVRLVFNDTVSFLNNRVIEAKSGYNAYGGAVSAYSNGNNYFYLMSFNGATTFDSNYVYSLNGAAHGGAIYYDGGTNAVLNLGPNSSVINNAAKTLGGGIYLNTGTINLNADGGNILFQGNRQGVTFTGSGSDYAPDMASGLPNAIYLAQSGSLNMAVSAGNVIDFYDPIASAANATITVNKTGDGEVVFHGNSADPGDVSYNSNIQTNTNVNGGTFTFTDAVQYGNVGVGTFAVGDGGTVMGNNGSALLARTIAINSGGTVAANGGTFILNAGTGGVTSTAGRFSGFGTIVAPTLSLSGSSTNISTADIAAGNTLVLDSVLTDAGGLAKIGDGIVVLTQTNTYTGTTRIAAGTLQADTTDIIAASAGLSMSGGIFDLNTYDQTVNNLSGTGGEVALNDALLTVNSLTDTVYAGVISGTGSLTKQNSGTLTLSGDNRYSGGTTIDGGTLIATQGNTLGSGTINNNSILQLNFSTNSVLNNLLLGAGSLIKTGSGTASLSASGSRQGAVNVNAGTLNFTQPGDFTAASLTTGNGATTALTADATLSLTGALTQLSGSTLNVTLGGNGPAITAQSAALDGTLRVSGIDTGVLPTRSSDLDDTFITLIRTTNGISNDFANVIFDAQASPVDYLALFGSKSSDNNDYNVGFGLTWFAGTTLGNGLFTLANSGDEFIVDTQLTNQSPSATTWNGTTLTKAGLGTLTLAAQNTYSGDTLINAGTLRTGVDNAFANSANVVVAAGATLDLAGFSQQANLLAGEGNIVLGNGTLNAVNSTDSAFSGMISGDGALVKQGTGTLTLSGANTFSGGSTLNAGTLTITQGAGLGSGAIANNATLALLFTQDSTFANVLSGSGSLIKRGAGTATLSAADSTQGAIVVEEGALNFIQNGVFNAASLTTSGNATTTLAAGSSLNLSGAFTQNVASILNIAIGSVQPVITAQRAALSGTLNVTGFSAVAPTSASELTNTEFTVIRTTEGISGDFDAINFGGAASQVDYLTLDGRINGLDYNVGFGLTWLAGAQQGNGIFTLQNQSDRFDVDVALNDQAQSATGWDGSTLTKNGAGTLILSAVNGYRGDTLINGGTLQTGIANAFANSANVTVASGATLDLNNFSQQANNLSGSGNITLGSGTLTVNNNAASGFSGVISGSGALVKAGAETFTLSGNNTYSGGSTLNAGTVIATQGNALGSGIITNNAALQLDFASNSTLANQLGGSGSLTKTGSGTATLTGAGSSAGDIAVNAGAVEFAQNGVFDAQNLTTAGGATTSLAANSTLSLNGELTQSANSTLSIAIGTVSPIIDAVSAEISGTLRVTGIDANVRPDKASELEETQFTLIRTVNGIAGDFTQVDLGGISSSVDYLTFNAGKSEDNLNYNVGFGLTWLAGDVLGNGVFTLTEATDRFEVDIALTNQTNSATGWDGATLTKNGAGTLILSAENTYTGNTVINGGAVQTNIANAFADSQRVTINNGGTLNLNGFDQMANNLTGSGSITLGNGDLTVASTDSTQFSGAISGNGSLIKTGNETLTLSGINFYRGGTRIDQGRLVATQGQALGQAEIVNNAELALAFAQDSELTNQLSGSGSLIKTGAGTATLSNTGSSQGSVVVEQGRLRFTQNGTFTADDYRTNAGATTSLAANASLTVANQFDTQGTLAVMAGSANPVVSADTATLGAASIFNLSGYSAPETTSASQLAYNQFRVITTSAPGNLSGDFASINLGGATSPVDYLTLTPNNDGQNYDIGLALTWYAAYSATPERANGVFTLTGANEYFDMDVVLADQSANATTGWDGRTLIKQGAGTLQLSKANTYSGATLVNGGTLSAGNRNVIAASERVTLAAGTSFVLNNFDQTFNNLSGAGNIVLGTAALTINDSENTLYAGEISGYGSVTKTGEGRLVLSANQAYTGVTTVSAGTLQLGNGGASGSVIGDITNDATLVFNRSDDYIYTQAIGGSGDVIQQGSGRLMFNHDQTWRGTTAVNSGALLMLDDAMLTQTSRVTVAQGALFGGYGGTNGDVINNGVLAVADAAFDPATNPAGTFTIGGNLTNNGQLFMASPDPQSRLVVNGNYAGNNGLLTLSTQLGGDNSLTDQLIVRGDTSGTTRVVVNNAGGTGAQTVNGIEIIHVDGQSNGEFTLANRVVAGAYDYGLYQGQPTVADGNWYLRSVGEGMIPGGESRPQWRPEAGIYLGNQAMAQVVQQQTLFDRQGSQYQNVDSGAWGRIIGGHVDSKAAGKAIDINSDYTLIQFGSDVYAHEFDAQKLVIGLMGSWAYADIDAKGNRGMDGNRHSASGKMEGFSVGVYGTWFADAQTQQGAYVDNWYQYGRYSNDVNGDGLPSDNYHSHPFAASLETGYSQVISDNGETEWRVIPQAQVIYNHYAADSFVDASNARIAGQKNDAWQTRVGTRVTATVERQDYTLEPYTEVNWWHSNQAASVSFDGQQVKQDKPTDRAEVKVGVQANVADRWSAYVQVEAQTGAGDYHRYGGGVGVRYTF